MGDGKEGLPKTGICEGCEEDSNESPANIWSELERGVGAGVELREILPERLRGSIRRTLRGCFTLILARDNVVNRISEAKLAVYQQRTAYGVAKDGRESR